jgi:hypothetical protein
MSKETFVAACKLADKRGDGICLGGGEPTLHPLFAEFMGIAMMSVSCLEDQQLFIATNGSNTEISLKLARMARAGLIYAALSQDQWHDPIAPEVVKAFTKEDKIDFWDTKNRDFREIRTVEAPSNRGRAKKLKGIPKQDYCGCPELFVTPTGDIFWCACKTKALGTVFADDIPNSLDYESGTCYRDYLKDLKKDRELQAA